MQPCNQTNLCTPVSPLPCFIISPTHWTVLAYSSSINVLDYTSITISVTFADEKVDIVGSSFEPLSEIDKKNMDACMHFYSIPFRFSKKKDC